MDEICGNCLHAARRLKHGQFEGYCSKLFTIGTVDKPQTGRRQIKKTDTCEHWTEETRTYE